MTDDRTHNIGPSVELAERASQEGERLWGYWSLVAASSLVWFFRGPLSVFVSFWELPNEASWLSAWIVIHQEFCLTTGTVDVYQGILLGWHWSHPAFWMLHAGFAFLALRLARRRRMLELVVLPVILGQGGVLVLFVLR